MRKFASLAREGLISVLRANLPTIADSLGLPAPQTITYHPSQLPFGPYNAGQLPAVVVVPERSELEPETGGNTHYVGEVHDFTVHVGFLFPREALAGPVAWGEKAVELQEKWVQAVEEVIRQNRGLGLGPEYQCFAFVREHNYSSLELWQDALERSLLNSLLAVSLALRVSVLEVAS